MLDAEAVQHPDQVLGGEVAGGAAGVRAAAEPARGGVDDGHARPAGRPGCWPAPGRRCRGSARRAGRCPGRAHASAPSRAGDLAGGADADGVAEADLGAAHLRQRDGDAGDLVDRDVALPRVAEAHRDVAAHRPRPRPRARSTTGANISSDSATVRLRLRWAKLSVALANTAISRTPQASARSRPRALGTSTGARAGRSPPSSASSSLGVAELRHPGRGARSW